MESDAYSSNCSSPAKESALVHTAAKKKLKVSSLLLPAMEFKWYGNVKDDVSLQMNFSYLNKELEYLLFPRVIFHAVFVRHATSRIFLRIYDGVST